MRSRLAFTFDMGDEILTVDVDELIASAKAAQDQAVPEDVEVLFGEQLTKVRLWPLTRQAWRELVDKHAARFDLVDGRRVVSQSDVAYGFNTATLPEAYPRVAIVQGDEEQKLDKATWKRLLQVMPEDGYAGVLAVIVFMNVGAPAQRTMEALGKAFMGEGVTPGS